MFPFKLLLGSYITSLPHETLSELCIFIIVYWRVICILDISINPAFVGTNPSQYFCITHLYIFHIWYNPIKNLFPPVLGSFFLQHHMNYSGVTGKLEFPPCGRGHVFFSQTEEEGKPLYLWKISNKDSWMLLYRVQTLYCELNSGIFRGKRWKSCKTPYMEA